MTYSIKLGSFVQIKQSKSHVPFQGQGTQGKSTRSTTPQPNNILRLIYINCHRTASTMTEEAPRSAEQPKQVPDEPRYGGFSRFELELEVGGLVPDNATRS